MTYKVRNLKRGRDDNHPAAQEYFDAEFGQVLIVELGEKWWYAKRFLEFMNWKNKEEDFFIQVDMKEE